MVKKLAVIIPAYNEEPVIEKTTCVITEILHELMEQEAISPDSRIIYVNDGSTDRTWEMITEYHAENPLVEGIKFSRNFGHQNALVAGLETTVERFDAFVTIDCDLQDDPQAIREMVNYFNHGTDIVYGVRNNRDSDTWFKRNTAQAYYKMLNRLGVELVPNSADFRLLSQRAVREFLLFTERNLFIRGIIPRLGFKAEKAYYKRTPREAGKSKYPFNKMLSFAWDGISSFSETPVRLILFVGILVDMIAIMMLIYTVVVRWMGNTADGWSSLMVSVWFIGGLQMIGVGIIGEYIGKLTLETKRRPRYIIDKIID